MLRPLGVAPPAMRLLGVGLVAATLGGFALAAICTLGIVPPGLWAASIVVGTVASLSLLVLFFRPWLVLGVGIDLALLWAVLVAGWLPDAFA